MRQIAHPLPAGVPLCRPGHHPQLVQTLGAPRGHRIGAPCPAQWHVECHQCGIATRPIDRQAIALLRWRGSSDLFHVPLSQLAQARLRACEAIANAA